jgi:hypothetical protein
MPADSVRPISFFAPGSHSTRAPRVTTLVTATALIGGGLQRCDRVEGTEPTEITEPARSTRIRQAREVATPNPLEGPLEQEVMLSQATSW